jgi:hypothetical protein
MSGRPTDHLEPVAKKRGSDRQLTKDDGSDDDGDVVRREGGGTGIFSRSDSV